MTRNINIFLRQDNIILRIKEDATKRDIMAELNEKLPELKRFYKEDKTPILVTGKILKKAEIDDIQDLIQREMKDKVDFVSPRTLGLHGIKKTFKKEIETSETKYYKGSLRSGQRIEFEGSVAILGDVNDGAEVIAEDNIVVLGTLRGMAHAGAKGNEKALIAAHAIESPQIRISSMIKERTRDEIDMERYSYAYISDEGVIEME